MFPTFVCEYLEEDDGSYSLRVPEFPGCFSAASSFDEIEPMIRDAISVHQNIHLMDFDLKFVKVNEFA